MKIRKTKYPQLLKIMKSMRALVAVGAFLTPCFAGKAISWESVPAPVRKTLLAHGATAGQSVDIEGKKQEGKTVYEAAVKEKDGGVVDLVVTEDGKLLDRKRDDATDRAQEKAERQQKVLSGVKFSNPRNITNPYLPLALLKQDIIEGSEGGKKTRIEKTAHPERKKTFIINDQKVEALIVEDRAFVNGELEEVAVDYFAQDDQGTVYYLGEEVDEYENGKVIHHDGSWMLGQDTAIPGVIMPAHPQVGDKFKAEDVSAEINESDEVISVSETVTVPAGTFSKCVKIKETLADGKIEFKYYAPGVGVVREVPPGGDELLISHKTK